MSTINTSSFAKALWPGVRAWYGQTYDEYEVEFEKLFDKETSTKNYEELVGTSGFGLAVEKTQGAGISYDTSRQGFTTRATHIVYALGFIITREMMEDDQYDVIGKTKAQALAMSIRQTKEVLGHQTYNRAFNGSFTFGDGKELIATARPNVVGGTWSNIIGTAADMSEASLEQSVIDLAGFTNDRGLKIAVKPDSLIIPYQLMFEAQRILKSVGRVDTADNTLNALNSMGMFKNVIVSHYLTDPDAWFIRTNVKNGMIYFERRADEFDMDNDWDTENAKFKASFRASWTCGDARSIYGSPGA